MSLIIHLPLRYFADPSTALVYHGCHLINLLGRSDIFARAYADDVVVSVAGKFTEVLSDRMQTD